MKIVFIECSFYCQHSAKHLLIHLGLSTTVRGSIMCVCVCVCVRTHARVLTWACALVSCISCTGRQILYHCASLEALGVVGLHFIEEETEAHLQ